MFYSANVQKFMSVCSGTLVVISGYEVMQLSGDMAAPFLQESNFWWLTGIEEPGWKAILDSARGRVVLVRPTLTEIQQVFDGGLTDAEALAVSGAQAVIPEAEFERELAQLARKHPLVRTVENKHGDSFVVNPAQTKLTAQLKRHFNTVEYCNKQLAELRAIKTAQELECITKAVAATTDVFAAVRANWETYKYEYQVEAAFTAQFGNKGLKHAYAPIVAGGPRACTLHYDKNNAKLAKREAVVIDIGARLGGYAADITRTYCAQPTKRMQQVHAALEAAHAQIIALLKPGLPVAEYGKHVDDIMQQALLELGLIKTKDDKAYHTYFPHAVSHGLGVDVHDSLGGPRYLQPGMVLTVEPGIYIAKEGIGMRIEDDILITQTGHKNMSASLSTAL